MTLHPCTGPCAGFYRDDACEQGGQHCDKPECYAACVACRGEYRESREWDW